MEVIGLRLKKYLEYKDVKRADFAEEVNMSYASLTHLLNGNRNMSSDMLDRIFTYFPDLNARWFVSGKGPMEYTVSSYFIDQEKEYPVVKEEPMYDRDQLLREFIEDEDVLNAVRNLLDKALEQNVKQIENKE
ncbi:helix-turn-helix domain-containing protein [Myroides fluvii]|uniref:helix-turn-helix domain-containing protein n=1 Tax=Myroides fluvii TaxID=2572594 RepID=UPI00131DC426|nr:helix-turn-helix transcriptional regulator [Myroides fluvii]